MITVYAVCICYSGVVSHSIVSGFPGRSAGKESACNAGDLDLIPGLGRSIKRTDLFSFLEGGAGGW